MGLILYGKVPMRGDFITHRAPDTLVEPWHAFVVDGLSACQARLGDRWRNHFLRAPIWRFALAGGLVGEAPVLGAVMPSVDGGGRLFPLMAGWLMDTGIEPLRALCAAHAWFTRLEDCLLSALDEGAVLNTLLGRIDALPPPDVREARADLGAPFQCSGLTAFEPAALGLAGLIASAAGLGKHGSAWWCVDGIASDGSDKQPQAGLMLRDGLPRAEDWPYILGLQQDMPDFSAVADMLGK